MDLVFTKKIAFALTIIGAIAIIFNLISALFLHKNSVIAILTFFMIITLTIIMYLGYKRPSAWVGYFQAIGAWLISCLALLDDPGSFSGIFFAITSYLLFVEHKILRNTLARLILTCSYFIPIMISIVVLKRSIEQLPPIYLLTSFFCFFLYYFVRHIKQQDRKTIDKSIEIIEKLESKTEELLQISKRQGQLLDEQAEQIDELKKLTIAS